jgi:hypothetical protein
VAKRETARFLIVVLSQTVAKYRIRCLFLQYTIRHCLRKIHRKFCAMIWFFFPHEWPPLFTLRAFLHANCVWHMFSFILEGRLLWSCDEPKKHSPWTCLLQNIVESRVEGRTSIRGMITRRVTVCALFREMERVGWIYRSNLRIFDTVLCSKISMF